MVYYLMFVFAPHCLGHIVSAGRWIARKNIVIALIVLISLGAMLYPTIADETYVYYVSSAGNDANNGLAPADEGGGVGPWLTQGQVNTFAASPGFSNGDTVLFNGGDTFDDATLGSPGVSNFTFSSYGTGKAIMPGSTRIPFQIDGGGTITGLTISNFDIFGSRTLNSTNLYVTAVGGIVIHDIDCDGHGGGTAFGQDAISVVSPSAGNVEIYNCNISNMGPATIPSVGTDDIGIIIQYMSSGHLYIHDNTIHDVNADCIQVWMAKGASFTSDISNNVLYNYGENAIDYKDSSNANIHANVCYREDTFTGDGGSGSQGYSIALHTPDESATTGNSVYDNIIGRMDNVSDRGGIGITDVNGTLVYNNFFYRLDRPAIFLDDLTGVTIYKNRMEQCAGNVFIQNTTANFSIYYNLMINPMAYSVGGSYDGGGIYENNLGTGGLIANNTIAVIAGTGTCPNPINLDFSSAALTNNIVSGAIDDDAYDHPVRINATVVPTYNCVYSSAGTKRVRWGSTNYSSSAEDLALFQGAGGTGSIFSDPLLTDPASDDFTLQAGSPCRGAADRAVWSGVASITDYAGAVITDASGNVINPLDIGAYQSRLVLSATDEILISLIVDPMGAFRLGMNPIIRRWWTTIGQNEVRK
jgi:hypothetical protein